MRIRGAREEREASRRDMLPVFPGSATRVDDILLRRLVLPAMLGPVVDRQPRDASVASARAVPRVGDGRLHASARGDPSDRQSLIVSLCHGPRSRPLRRNRTGIGLPGAEAPQTHRRMEKSRTEDRRRLRRSRGMSSRRRTPRRDRRRSGGPPTARRSAIEHDRRERGLRWKSSTTRTRGP
jgi:hypothetical protein